MAAEGKPVAATPRGVMLSRGAGGKIGSALWSAEACFRFLAGLESK
jgi:hypothetical protein